MIFQLPWLNEYIGQLFANQSETLPSAFGLFYYGLNIGSTYFIPMIIVTVGAPILYLFYYCNQ